MKAVRILALHLLDGYDSCLRALRPRRTAEFAALRPGLRAKGVRFGRDCLARFGVASFRQLTRAQLATLRAELG